MAVRFPLCCDVSFEQAGSRVIGHRGLGAALDALTRFGDGDGSLPSIPPEVPLLSAQYVEDRTWNGSAVARRTATGLAKLFDGGGDWAGVVDHLQYLLHVAKAGRSADNAVGGAVLLAGGCLLPGHRWAGYWSMAGATRLAAWLEGSYGLIDEQVEAAVSLVGTEVGSLGDVIPALPAGAAEVLAGVLGRSIEPSAGLYAMHPSDAQMDQLLSGTMAEAVEQYVDGIKRLGQDRHLMEVLFPEMDPDREELAEICRNVLTLRAHMHVKHDYGDSVDWSTVLNGDIESNVSLNHHVHITELVRGYVAYGDERYAEHAVRLLRSWFDQSPCPDVWAGLQWRTLEVGGRLTSGWLTIPIGLMDYAPFVATCLPDLVRWTLASARYLAVYPGPWNNWLQVEASGALVAAQLIPQWRDAELIRTLCWQRLAWINSHMFLPDGMQSENAPHYHTFPWSRLLISAMACETLGGDVPDDYWAFLELGTEPLWKLRMPVGGLPPFSDASPRHDVVDSWFRLVGERRGRADMVAVAAGDFDSPDLPDPCQHLPEAGFTAVRTGWRTDDDCVIFDHGFYGTNHQHEDKLAFIYCANGRQLVGDAGIYRYSFDQWEQYYRGAWGHNAVMVDGKQQCRANDLYQGVVEAVPDPDAVVRVEPEHYALLSGWYRDGFAPRSFCLWDRGVDRSADEAQRDRSIRHQRLLLYVWRRGLLVVDRIIGHGEHDVRQIFHLQPFESGMGEHTVCEPGHLAVDGCSAWLTQPGHTGVWLAHSMADMTVEHFCGQTDPPRGWTSLYGEQPSHDVHFLTRATLPLTMAAWIEPTKPDQSEPDATLRVEDHSGRIDFEVTDTSRPVSGVIDADAVTVEMR